MRVLAVTTNASLVVALGSMMREWEVVTVRDVERALTEAAGASVALIDLGETDAGVQVADQLFRQGITIPCVVIGDKSVDDGRATVLVRPFTLDDLGTAVREAAADARPAAPGLARPSTPEPEVRTPAPEPAPPPEKVEHEGNGSPAVASWPERPEPAPRKPPPPPEPEELRVPLKVVSEPAQRVPAEPKPEPVVEPPLHPPVFARPEPEPELEREPDWEQGAAEPAAEDSAFWDEPTPTEPAPAAEPAGRWKLRRKPTRTVATETASEAPLVQRLKRAAAHAHELDELIEQMPFLADLGAMAEGVIGEIDRQFVCAIASVSVKREDGYRVVAHRGLSRVEAGMVIPETQSLFSDVLKTREGVLIQPVDLAQGLVAGIGGARTEAMMVAPALVNGAVVAMVVVGGDRFTEADLDRLTDLAAEGAPGVAVAEVLDRLRGRADL